MIEPVHAIVIEKSASPTNRLISAIYSTTFRHGKKLYSEHVKGRSGLASI